jgi:heptosyltransferase-3
MKAPRRILVVVTRRIGDVLLATPVIRSLRRHWPEATIDVLVFRGTEGVLAGNPDVCSVLTVAERPTKGAHLALATRLWRRYDLSVSLVPSDRPTIYAWLAGRCSCGLVVDAPKHCWKQWLLDVAVDYDNGNTHTVNLYLRALEPLGVPAITEVVPARPEKDMLRIDALLRESGVSGDFAVLHPSPKFPYKMWTQNGWGDTGRWLQRKGLQIVVTGGPDAEEHAYVGAIAARLPGAVNLAGKISLAETACLLAQARLYIGPDTAVTHLAAAVGTPTIALFGPSDPVKWGPWPTAQRGRHNPWRRCGSQRAGNVFLLQGTGLCVPCMHEGCARRIESFSDCLQQMPASRIIAAAETLLKEPLMPRTQLNPHVQ